MGSRELAEGSQVMRFAAIQKMLCLNVLDMAVRLWCVGRRSLHRTELSTPSSFTPICKRCRSTTSDRQARWKLFHPPAGNWLVEH